MTVFALTLLAILLALAAIFVQYLMRENRLDNVRRVGTGERRLTASDPQFYETFQLLTNTTIYEGNRIDVLLNGEETFPRLFDDLRAAKSLITWHVFFVRRGRLADEVKEILVERGRQGVQIFFLLDAFGHNLEDEYVRELKDAGVEVAHFRKPHWNNLYKVQQRMHIRAVTIDGEIGYTGGFGIDDCWSGNGRQAGQWRDTNVRVVGPAVDQLQASFIANWAETTGDLLVGDQMFHPADEKKGDVPCGIMHTAPSLGSTNGERYYVLSIAGARQRLYITNPYFIPDRDFRKLLGRAVRDGVDVRVLTPGRNNDKKAVFWASRHHYEELLSHGVRIWEYRPTMIHAKTLVADGIWFSIGTINFDNRSITLNDEVTLAGYDEAIGRQMEEMFLEDLEYADEVKLEEFQGRGRGERWMEWMWSRVELVL